MLVALGTRALTVKSARRDTLCRTTCVSRLTETVRISTTTICSASTARTVCLLPGSYVCEVMILNKIHNKIIKYE